jgi:hypothetical protein
MSMTDSPLRLGTAATVIGTVVRYGFYAAGAFVFVLIAIVMIPFLRSDPVRRVDDQPAFRLASPELARLPMSGSVTTGRGSRVEMRQYGRLHDRDKDFTVLMVMPPKDQGGARDFAAEMNNFGSLQGGLIFVTAYGVQTRVIYGSGPLQAAQFSSTYHDLQTRFGPVRAREFRINADGRDKLCLAYLSRFETSSVYLKGWYCEGSGIKAGSWDLACTLDSLVLDRALASSEADAFVRERMKRPKQCSAEPVTQTTDTRPPRPTVRRY